MSRNGKVPFTAGLHKQTLTFAGAVLAQLPMISEEKQQHYVGKPEQLKKVLVNAFANDLIRPSFSSDLIRWGTVYGKLFGLKQKPDLSVLRIPEKPEGVGPVRLIVVVREILDWMGKHHGPLQAVEETLKEHFVCWQYVNNLDESITTNERDLKNGSYSVWVKDVREADEENANKSADDLKAMGHTGITVLERQLMEADVFFEKGEHLDQQNVTLCSGSRYRAGLVPNADWCGKFNVYWFNTSDHYPSLRSRRVWA